MIAKDEEKSLGRFLQNVKGFADEIVIVDSGSIDNTKKIASKFTKNVYDFKWNDDFSAARNFSISKATKDWILVLDPDEIISKNDLIKLKKIISLNEKGIMGYRLIQKTFFNGNVVSIRGICRVFKNDKRIKFIYNIHETVRESIKKIKGKIGKTGITIEHYPKMNREKQEYYLKLLKTKKEKFCESNADKEIENELKLLAYPKVSSP